MKLSDSEKLLLLMVSEIYEQMQIEGEVDPKFIQSAIYDGCDWAIGWKYSGLPFESQDAPPEVYEILEVLEMWRDIEESYARLETADKQTLEEKTKPFGNNPKFYGFDGNNESEHMSLARFIVHKLDKFEEFKGRDFNSHCPAMEVYQRMLSVFRVIRAEEGHHVSLTVDQLAAILAERTHPSNRK